MKGLFEMANVIRGITLNDGMSESKWRLLADTDAELRICLPD